MTTTGMQTIPEISSNRRAAIKQAVIEILSKYSDGSLPVKIGNIIRLQRNTIKLITYSSVIHKDNLSYAQVVSWAGSEDAFCVHNRHRNKYCIYYNDVSKPITNSNRVRWNLAHELGHVLLKHHDWCNSEKLFRGTVDDQTYWYLEAEANYFAQLILVPHLPLYYLNVKTSHQIRDLCQISNRAATWRFEEYKVWQRKLRNNSKDYNDPYDFAIFQLFYNFIYKKECQRCGAGFVQRHGKRCPICGHKPIKRGDGDRMKYPLLEINSLGKVKICPRCDNEDTEVNGEHCQICGVQLVNRCSNQFCKSSDPLPTNARFCPICGEPSGFYESEILAPWDHTDKGKAVATHYDIGDDELPF